MHCGINVLMCKLLLYRASFSQNFLFFGQHLATKKYVLQCLSNNATSIVTDPLITRMDGSLFVFLRFSPVAVFSFSPLRYLLFLRTVFLCMSFTLFFFSLVSWIAFSAGQNLVTFSHQCGFCTAGCTDNCSRLGLQG